MFPDCKYLNFRFMVNSLFALYTASVTVEYLRDLRQYKMNFQVKNKLDARFYAIKRIPLNPKSQQFNKKITREVKLLSRLSHENVVR